VAGAGHALGGATLGRATPAGLASPEAEGCGRNVVVAAVHLHPAVWEELGIDPTADPLPLRAGEAELLAVVIELRQGTTQALTLAVWVAHGAACYRLRQVAACG